LPSASLKAFEDAQKNLSKQRELLDEAAVFIDEALKARLLVKYVDYPNISTWIDETSNNSVLTKLENLDFDKYASNLDEDLLDLDFKSALNVDAELLGAWKKLSHLPQSIKTNPTNLLQRNMLDEYADGIASASNARKGNFGEIGADLDLNAKGYNSLIDRIDNIDSPGHNGIDGVFEKNGQYYIVEGKYTGSASLNPANQTTGLPRQMSDDWIQQKLVDAVGQDLADDILDAGYTRVLAKVAPDGTVTYKYVSETGYLTQGGGPLGDWIP
jgi:hypothetical protein